jgi:hypothetical protein
MDKPASILPQVTVEGTTLLSRRFPQGTIKINPDLNYVGGETFILYNIASCEIHLFAKADETGRILRLYWFQFEEYLPSAIPRRYDYSKDPYRTKIGNHEFYDSVRYYNVANARKDWSPESDSMHVIRLLEKKGFRLKDDVMRIRLVRLDKEWKKELMIIYMEDLSQHGLSLKDFVDANGELTWKEVSKGLRNRIITGMKLDME